MGLDEVLRYDTEAFKKYSSSVEGYRGDINLFVRSTWEANVARVLLFKGVPFVYEPEVFKMTVPQNMKSIFDGREEVEYTPDFYLPNERKYLEVKGDWFAFGDQQAMAKIILFRMMDPERVVKIIGVAQYRKLEQDYKHEIDVCNRFAGWERGSRMIGPNLATDPDHFGSGFYLGKAGPRKFLGQHHTFLKDISQHPSDGIVKRHKRLGWSAGKSYRILSNLIEFNAVRLDRRITDPKRGGRPIVVAQLTPSGEELLNSLNPEG